MNAAAGSAQVEARRGPLSVDDRRVAAARLPRRSRRRGAARHRPAAIAGCVHDSFGLASSGTNTPNARSGTGPTVPAVDPRPPFPFARGLLDALRSYDRRRLRADILAGLIVGTVALPLSMALAVAVGLPPQHGLYTAIIAGALIALTGGSATQVSGPTAAFIVILAPIVAEHGIGGLCVASLLAGVMLLFLGLFRLGRLITLVPFPVVTGFTLGIGLSIMLGQIPDALGIDGRTLDSHPLPRLLGVLGSLDRVRAADLAVGLGTFALLVVWPRVDRRIPAPLIALTVASIGSYALAHFWPDFDPATIRDRFDYLASDGTRVPGIPSSPPSFAWPWQLGGADGVALEFGLPLFRQLWLPAVSIALLGAIESLLSATVADGMSGTRHDPDSELVGQGLGNLIAPFFGGFAATGAIARTATNVRSGATSPIASVVHAGFLLLSMLVFAPALGYLPMAALAALLIKMAWSMCDWQHVIRTLRRASAHDSGVLLVCASLTVAFDMVIAVVVGIALASLLFMKRIAELADVKLIDGGTQVPGSDLPAGVLVYEIAGPLFFGAAERAMASLARSNQRDVKVVVLDVAAVPVMDHTGVVNLESVVGGLRRRGIGVIFAGLRDSPRRTLERAGMLSANGVEVAIDRAAGIARALDWLRRDVIA
ncbi:MAG: C4-dicarboxylic acid transporter DauA [Planctomycetota bacterium]